LLAIKDDACPGGAGPSPQARKKGGEARRFIETAIKWQEQVRLVIAG
jgi:hypothetical protein